jgi:tetratricopeptide (TPR) repeat protein
VALLEKAEPDGAVLEALIRSDLAVGRLREAGLVAQRGVPAGTQALGLQQAIAITTTLARRRDLLLQSFPRGMDKVAAFVLGVERVVCAEYAWSQGRSAVVVEELLTPAFADGLAIGPAFGLRGLLALERGRLTRALVDAERAVALAPQEPLGYQVRGRVRLERGTPGELADLQKAAELSRRQDAYTLHWLAAAQFRLGHSDEALATQREAVRLRPRDNELIQQLEEFEKSGKIGLHRS